MRKTALLIAALAGLPSAAQAADCGKLQLFDTVQMVRTSDGRRDFIPVTLNGVQKNFLFDTGGDFSQVGSNVAEELKLPKSQGRYQLMDATGHISRIQASVHQFSIGHMLGTDLDFAISPVAGLDGLVALDHLMRMDVDMDFGSDKLSLFSPDHCAGDGLYWKAPVSAVVPLRMDGYHAIVPVTLDGHEEKAMIDTGANSLLMIDEAQRVFGLEMGSADTPENGGLNGDATLKTYKHTFKTLAFGDVQVNNPTLALIPNAFGRNMDRNQLVGSRAYTEKDRLNIPIMVIGMDVLRNMHVYLSFKEDKMYITQSATQPQARPTVITREQLASLPASELQADFKKYMTQKIVMLNQRLAADPKNTIALADRCSGRAAMKIDLDAALADCDQALQQTPNDFRLFDSRALVLYQQGKYQDAVAAYDKALAASPKYAPSLFMRGHAKGKLGDQSGADADIAAAKASNPEIETSFKPYDIDF